MLQFLFRPFVWIISFILYSSISLSSIFLYPEIESNIQVNSEISILEKKISEIKTQITLQERTLFTNNDLIDETSLDIAHQITVSDNNIEYIDLLKNLKVDLEELNIQYKTLLEQVIKEDKDLFSLIHTIINWSMIGLIGLVFFLVRNEPKNGGSTTSYVLLPILFLGFYAHIITLGISLFFKIF